VVGQRVVARPVSAPAAPLQTGSSSVVAAEFALAELAALRSLLLPSGRLLRRLTGNWHDPESAETGRDCDQARTPEKLHANIPFHSAFLK
jgi:hypothetical protein